MDRQLLTEALEYADERVQAESPQAPGERQRELDHFVIRGNRYFPNMTEKTTKTLPPGIYTPKYAMGTVIFEIHKINTDELHAPGYEYRYGLIHRNPEKAQTQIFTSLGESHGIVRIKVHSQIIESMVFSFGQDKGQKELDLILVGAHDKGQLVVVTADKALPSVLRNDRPILERREEFAQTSACRLGIVGVDVLWRL